MAEIRRLSEQIQVIRRYEVSGTGPVRRPHSDLSVVPEALMVTFVDGKLRGVDIEGRRMKKDGGVGEVWTTAHWYSPDPDELPEWAVPLTKYEED